jgi:hypothetical protein
MERKNDYQTNQIKDKEIALNLALRMDGINENLNVGVSNFKTRIEERIESQSKG